jgi:hypothetical protein
MVMRYWQVGRRIRQNILKEKRAEYDQEIVSTLSGKLVAEFGRDFSQQNLFRMADFADSFPCLRRLPPWAGLLSSFANFSSAEIRHSSPDFPSRCRA